MDIAKPAEHCPQRAFCCCPVHLPTVFRVKSSVPHPSGLSIGAFFIKIRAARHPRSAPPDVPRLSIPIFHFKNDDYRTKSAGVHVLHGPVRSSGGGKNFSGDGKKAFGGPDNVSGGGKNFFRGDKKVFGGGEKVSGGSENFFRGSGNFSEGEKNVSGGVEKVFRGSKNFFGGGKKVSGGSKNVENAEFHVFFEG